MSGIQAATSFSSTSRRALSPHNIHPPVMTHSVHTRTMEAWLHVKEKVNASQADAIEKTLIESCYALTTETPRDRLSFLAQELVNMRNVRIQHIIDPVIARLEEALNLIDADRFLSRLRFGQAIFEFDRGIESVLQNLFRLISNMAEGPQKNYLSKLLETFPFDRSLAVNLTSTTHLSETTRMDGDDRLVFHAQFLKLLRNHMPNDGKKILVVGSDTVGLLNVLLGWMLGFQVRCLRSPSDRPSQIVILSDNDPKRTAGSIEILRWFGVADYLLDKGWAVEDRETSTFSTTTDYLESALKNIVDQLQIPFLAHQTVELNFAKNRFSLTLGSVEKIQPDVVIVADEKALSTSQLNCRQYELTETVQTCVAVFESTIAASASIGGKRKLNKAAAQQSKRNRTDSAATRSTIEIEEPPLFKRVKYLVLPEQTILEMSWEGKAAPEKTMGVWAQQQRAMLQPDAESEELLPLSSVSLSSSRVQICSHSSKVVWNTMFLFVGNAENKQCPTTEDWYSTQIIKSEITFVQLVKLKARTKLNTFDPFIKRDIQSRWLGMNQPPLLDFFLMHVNASANNEQLRSLLTRIHLTHFLTHNNLSCVPTNFTRRFSLLVDKLPKLTDSLKRMNGVNSTASSGVSINSLLRLADVLKRLEKVTSKLKDVDEDEEEIENDDSDAEQVEEKASPGGTDEQNYLSSMIISEIAGNCLETPFENKFGPTIKPELLKSNPAEYFEKYGIGALPPDLLVHMQQLVLANRNPLLHIQAEYFQSPPPESKLPRGMLLVGPSGTGKTLVAEKLASLLLCEQVLIMKAHASGTLEGFKNVNSLKRIGGKRCLIILDNVDKWYELQGGPGEITCICDAALSKPNIFIVGTTNSPDKLGSEIKSAGRLFPIFKFARPDLTGRLSILRIHLKSLMDRNLIDRSIDLDFLAEMSDGMVGSEIEAMIQKVYVTWSQSGSRGRIPTQDFAKILAPRNTEHTSASRLLSSPQEHLEEMGIGGMSEECIQALKAIAIERIQPADNSRDEMIQSRGILISGPPGTGKTTLARQFAQILGVPKENVRLVSGSDFLLPHVGDSEAMVRNIFDAARKASAYSDKKQDIQVLIIDEIDAIIAKRSALHNQFEKTLVNQFLYELDGLVANNKIFVVGITNNLLNIDTAALRPGRLYPTINIPLPDTAGRKAIFKIHTQKLIDKGILDADVSLDRLAEATPNMSGADISGLIHDVYKGWLLKRMAHDKDDPELPVIKMVDFEGVYRKTPVALPKKLFDSPEEFLEELGVAGLPKNCIEYLQNVVLSRSEYAEDLHKANIKVPRGIILSGPPGTGKTTLARHLGTILGIPNSRIISRSGASFMNMWVGESAANVRALFAPIEAESKRSGNYGDPFLVIIDEADALLGKRSDDHNSERRAALTTFLEYVDGLQIVNNVFIIAITNRPDTLDPAVSRPGRLHPTIPIENPDEKGRTALFRVHTKGLREGGLMQAEIDFGMLAKETQGLNGSHIASAIQAASLARIKRKVSGKGDPLVTSSDILEAIRAQKKGEDGPPPGMYT